MDAKNPADILIGGAPAVTPEGLRLAAVLAAAAGAGLGFNEKLFHPVRPKTKARTRRVGYVVHDFGPGGKLRSAGAATPRNAACGCGSGLKTKKCCGRRT